MRRRILFGEWLNEWFAVYKKPYVKRPDNIECVLRLHIPRFIKACPLASLNVVDVQKALNSVSRSRTRQDVYGVYHGALTMAYRLGLMDRNIADLIVKPRHERKVGSALTSDELRDFLKAIENHRARLYFKFLLMTGCRRSEALLVRWSDIDYVHKIINVHGTKTATSDRIVPLLPDCELLLAEIEHNGDKVFHHRAEYVSKAFKKLCPAHKLHDLRHTFATRCFECGISMKVVQRWLGHSRIDTTASVYVHVADNVFAAEAEKFRLL